MLASEAEPARDLPRAAPTAPFSPRVIAFAADAMTALSVTAVAVLQAARAAGQAPSRIGLIWAAVFAIYLSFFLVLVPLVLFGRTLGMTLAGISAAPSGLGKRLSLRESAARWFGTVCTVAALGLPLLRSPGSSGAWTPADRLSGRPLVEDGGLEW
jgi:uncharacterized RDD family membrane protein YckC